MSGGVNNFPDGLAEGSLGMLPNPKAPEENYPPLVGEDLSWVAGPGGAKGKQPITSTNPNGDYAGVSPMSPGLDDVLSEPSVG
jgi:hypothetical protein